MAHTKMSVWALTLGVITNHEEETRKVRIDTFALAGLLSL